jgi:hypothetical protein
MRKRGTIRMKKLTALLLAVLLAFSLFACKGASSDTTTASATRRSITS